MTTLTRSRTIGEVNGKPIMLTPAGSLKIGQKGKDLDAGAVFYHVAGFQGKGAVRKLRKTIRAAGLVALAGMPIGR